MLNHFNQECDVNGVPVVVIGDRVFTDVYYGNLGNCLTILTRNILSEKGDNKISIKVYNLINIVD